MNPKSVNKRLRKKSHVQQPDSKATARGGRKMAKMQRRILGQAMVRIVKKDEVFPAFGHFIPAFYRIIQAIGGTFLIQSNRKKIIFIGATRFRPINAHTLIFTDSS